MSHHSPVLAGALLAALVACEVGCALSAVQGESAQSSSTIRTELERDHVLLRADFHVPRHDRLLDELSELRGRVATTLAIPACERMVEVRLFESPKLYRDFVRDRFPQFPERRACFVEQNQQLSVYAHWNDLIAIDLRHEVTHGYLHAVVPNLPLWLDEGLAEYFEVAASNGGVNPPHQYLLASRIDAGWRPSLERLEQVVDPGELGQAHYAEAWAWAHWLLETTPERRTLLQDQLARLRMTGAAPPLSLALRAAEPDIERSLLEHLAGLGKSR